MLLRIACVGLLVMSACVGQADEFDIEEGEASALLFGDVSRKTVCFTVHNGTDPVASTVTGTLYRGRGRFNADTPVVIASHGAAGNRSVWDVSMMDALDGERLLEEISFAPVLARAGYAVITYDRLGYGQSPYHGSGYDLVADNHVGMLHEIVTQVRGGSYRLQSGDSCDPAGSAPAFGSDTIVLAGHSFGGFMVSSYAGLYHDVAAIIPMGSATTGFANEFITNVFVPWIATQVALDDYFVFFPPNPNGPVSEECLRFLFYTPGADPDVYNTICDNDRMGVDTLLPTPSGEIITLPQFALVDTRERIKSIGDIPVLLAYTDHERFFKGPAEASADDPDVQTPELQYYRDNCGCDVSLFRQRHAGHMFFWHPSAWQTSVAVVAWLRWHGITN